MQGLSEMADSEPHRTRSDDISQPEAEVSQFNQGNSPQNFSKERTLSGSWFQLRRFHPQHVVSTLMLLIPYAQILHQSLAGKRRLVRPVEHDNPLISSQQSDCCRIAVLDLFK